MRQTTITKNKSRISDWEKEFKEFDEWFFRIWLAESTSEDRVRSGTINRIRWQIKQKLRSLLLDVIGEIKLKKIPPESLASYYEAQKDLKVQKTKLKKEIEGK